MPFSSWTVWEWDALEKFLERVCAFIGIDNLPKYLTTDCNLNHGQNPPAKFERTYVDWPKNDTRIHEISVCF